MTIFKHELRQGRISLLIWMAAILSLMVICIFLYPEMEGEMADMGDLFSSMGSFTAAFGMDRLNFGEFLGFYGVECGNILGLGGAFFASLIAISALAKEEKEHTAEFLLTHPVKRSRIVTEKLCALLAQLLILNGVVLAFSALSTVLIGESPDWEKLLLLHLAYLLLQAELAAVCFGISAFLRRQGLGIGLGIAAAYWKYCRKDIA